MDPSVSGYKTRERNGSGLAGACQCRQGLGAVTPIWRWHLAGGGCGREAPGRAGFPTPWDRSRLPLPALPHAQTEPGPAGNWGGGSRGPGLQRDGVVPLLCPWGSWWVPPSFPAPHCGTAPSGTAPGWGSCDPGRSFSSLNSGADASPFPAPVPDSCIQGSFLRRRE